jgi:transaldolase
MTKLHQLADLGQSVWYDFIRRSLITSGELQQLIDQGVRGITSNPAIFEKAIAGSKDYDEALENLAGDNLEVKEIYETLALADIAQAADLLRPVYDASQGRDGFVSLEVSPELAYDTASTVAEARRLFETLARPNVMIKVPATAQGLPAVSELIGLGVNVNVTLIFSVPNYQDVAAAYLAGLEGLARQGPQVTGGVVLDRIGSVASFFVSRLDSAVDKLLESKGQKSLAGKAAVANAKVAYDRFQRIFSGPRWDALAAQGARVQRVLWASTSTKNPDYRPTLYVDELIGPQTVNTVPPATLDRFMTDGKVAETLTQGLDEARGHLSALSEQGIDLEAVTTQLQTDGVTAFAKPFESLMATIAAKRKALGSSKKKASGLG